MEGFLTPLAVHRLELPTDGIRSRPDRPAGGTIGRVTIVPPVLHEAQLPLPERMAARLDGELFAIGEGHSPIDEVDRPALRLHAVLGSRPARLIAELATAAWVWGACDLQPANLELCVDLRARARPKAMLRASVREVVLSPDDTVVLEGLRVTTPIRTAVDLARMRDAFGVAEADLVRRLASMAGFDFTACRTFMARGRNLPAKRQATERLARCLR
jgi:hypothetical protein